MLMKNSTLRKILSLIAVFLFTASIYAQMPAAISISPEDATAYDEITLTFNATLACTPDGKQDLLGLQEVYMHSAAFELGQPEGWGNYGVDFDATGANGQAPILTANGDDTYSITYIPYDFYGFPEGTVITKITAVFNNGSWDAEGKDFIEGGCGDFNIPLSFVSGDPVLVVNCNMTKMINEEHFDPINDILYVDIDGLGVTELLDLDADGIYNATVEEDLIVDQGYTYKFRINDATYEDIQRDFTAIGGTVTVNVWWNDDPIIPPSVTTMIVDMRCQVELGNFDPSNDFVDVAGSFNGWGDPGSGPLTDLGDTTYSVDLNLEAGVIHEFKFRINANWDTSEFPNSGNRKLLGPHESKTITYFYDNYNTSTVPITLECNMNDEITAEQFNPDTDYLDVAGDFNGWGGYDVCFNNGENIYTIEIFVSREKIGMEQSFKFRINGNWDTAEFPSGGPNRKIEIQDTLGGVQNFYECTYNVIDTPYAPYAYDVKVEGALEPDNDATGSYIYFDPNAEPEGTSLFKWYVATQPDGSDKTEIAGATSINYTIVDGDMDKYLVFEVIPVASAGDPLIGDPQTAISAYKVGASGIDDNELANIKIFPNPVNDILYLENVSEISQISIYNIVGQKIITVNNNGSNNVNINTSEIHQGIYFVAIQNNDNTRTVKIIKK